MRLKSWKIKNLNLVTPVDALLNSRMVGVRGFPRTRITKSSCACDCGREPVYVGAFFFLLSASLTQNPVFKLRFL